MKFGKIIFFNLLSLFAFTCLLDFICLIFLLCKYNFLIEDPFFIRPFNPNTYDENYRKPSIPSIPSPRKSAVVVFGCSFAAGSYLNDYETLAAKISQLTGRVVFNRGDEGMGPQMMLYQLQTGRIKQITKDCDYFLYLYIMDHTNRIYKYRCFPFLYKIGVKYVLKNDKNGYSLVLKKLNPLLVNSNIYKVIEDRMPDFYDENEKYRLFYEIVSESNKLSKQQFPKSKFIILNYSQEPLPCEKEFEKEGIQIVDLKNFINPPEKLFTLDYQISETDSHPNARVWKDLTPKILSSTGIE